MRRGLKDCRLLPAILDSRSELVHTGTRIVAPVASSINRPRRDHHGPASRPQPRNYNLRQWHANEPRPARHDPSRNRHHRLSRPRLALFPHLPHPQTHRVRDLQQRLIDRIQRPRQRERHARRLPQLQRGHFRHLLDSWTATCIHFASISATARSIRSPTLMESNCLARILETIRTPRARRLGWNNTPPCRSRKVKSLRSATCFRSRVPTQNRCRR
jgi:hypothetical protein